MDGKRCRVCRVVVARNLYENTIGESVNSVVFSFPVLRAQCREPRRSP
jgi:hypothetical protein